MSKRQIAGIVLLASLTALAVILPFATTAQERRDFYAFEVELTSDRDGQAQVFFDVGRGINEADSFHQALPARAAYAVYRFPLPTGTLQGLRFDPIDREGRLAIRHAQIVSRFGDVVHQFVPADFRPARQIASLTINGDTLSLDTDRGATDPITELRLARPLPLPLTNSLLLRTMVPVAAGVFLGFLALALAATPLATDGRIARIRHWGEQRPLAWLAAAAAAGVALQCHPVVFFGRSFVSPDNAGFLLYDTFPTLPGYVSSGLEDAKGADVGATLYQHLYYPLEAHEALINDGELPLWNRFNLAGVPLLGQGQSTIGELMSLLPFFARSAAWAWDAKFILAHWAYGLGIGLAVFRLTRHPGVSALLAATAGYVGFFAFRINHPAQFSVCLAPWVLLAWFWVADARGWRSLGVALVAWVLANWELLTSGTIKEAYMIQVCEIGRAHV